MNKLITTKGGIKLKTAGTQISEDIIVVPNLQEKTITANGAVLADAGYCGLRKTIVSVPQGIPFDIATAAEMNALLISANVGRAYRYVGTTTDTYTNGDIYVVEVTE